MCLHASDRRFGEKKSTSQTLACAHRSRPTGQTGQEKNPQMNWNLDSYTVQYFNEKLCPLQPPIEEHFKMGFSPRFEMLCVGEPLSGVQARAFFFLPLTFLNDRNSVGRSLVQKKSFPLPRLFADFFAPSVWETLSCGVVSSQFRKWRRGD